jgi:excisionase family DNA binding protein
MDDDVERGLAMIRAAQPRRATVASRPIEEGVVRLMRAEFRHWQEANGREIPQEEAVVGSDDVLDADAVGAMLGIKRAAVLRMARKKAIPGARAGKGWRFSRSRVMDWIGGGSAATATGKGDEEPLPPRRGVARRVLVSGPRRRAKEFPAFDWSRDKP